MHCSAVASLTEPVFVLAGYRFIAQPSAELGGEEFAIQPAIEKLDNSGARDVNATDTLYISLQNPLTDPLEFQSRRLWSTNATSVDGHFEATMVDGVANWTHLYINQAYDGYVLEVETPISREESAPFNVSTGPADRVALVLQPGTATGGRVFLPQPLLEIQDMGGNLVELSGDEVSVSLSTSPAGGTLSGTMFMTYFMRGRAEFKDLSIDIAGEGYELQFTSNASIPKYNVTSDPFTVGVGPTERIVVLQQPSDGQGGIVLPVQPIVALVDAGGNINVNDSSSMVNVSIMQNANNAKLLPTYIWRDITPLASPTAGSQFVTLDLSADGQLWAGDMLRIGDEYPLEVQYVYSTSSGVTSVRLLKPYPGATDTGLPMSRLDRSSSVRVEAGVATFDGLFLDRIGVCYTLRFFSLMTEGNGWVGKGNVGYGYGYGRGDNLTIEVESDRFDISLGDPTALLVLRNSSDAWAGAQPFTVQPRVALVDGGGNVMTNREDGNVTVTVDESQNEHFAVLNGNVTMPLVLGVADFENLELSRRGEIRLVYTAELEMGETIVPTAEVVNVLHSSEYMVTADVVESRDFFGQSVAVDHDAGVAVVSAPLDDRPVYEVQIIQTVSNTTEFVDEVQIVKSQAVHQHEIQRIATWAPNWGEITGGWFMLIWNGQESARQVPYNALGDVIKVVLENDFDEVGAVDVTRSYNEECINATGVYQWDVTFVSLRGRVPDLAILASDLDGAGATVNVTELRPSTELGGSFALGFSSVNMTTRPLDHDVTSNVLALIIEQDLQTGPVRVTRNGPDNQEGYEWTITFAAGQDNYDPPPLTYVLCMDFIGHADTLQPLPPHHTFTLNHDMGLCRIALGLSQLSTSPLRTLIRQP